MIEYIHIDHNRLDSYFGQISGPISYDKVPVLEAELGLTGPKAKGTQIRPGRPFTTQEKLERVQQHLTEAGLLAEGIASYFSERLPFRLIRSVATPLLLPLARLPPEVRGAAPMMKIWLAPIVGPSGDRRRRLAVLLEDDRQPEEPHVYVPSSYNTLRFLMRSAEHREFPNALRFVFQDNAQAMIAEMPLRFIADPVAGLSSIGAIAGEPRKIVALLRVRAAFEEDDCIEPSDWRRLDLAVLYCYPIFIAEDDS